MAIELKIPNIGNFDAVDVIEVLMNVGDVIEIDQNILTLESDKASMEVPSDIAGTVTKILVKVGDQVKEGDVIAMIEAGAAAPAASEPKNVEAKAETVAPAPKAEVAPVATSASQVIDIKIPNIGNFDSVDVIDVAFAVGDTITKDQNLLTLESDKASMDVPSEVDGVITEVLVKVGDHVKEGSTIARATVGGSASAPKAEAKSTEAPKVSEPEVQAVAATSNFSLSKMSLIL